MNHIELVDRQRLVSRFGTALASVALAACAPSSVTVGNMIGPSDAGAASETSAPSPCAAAPVPLLGCASGPTELVCDPSSSPPHWSVICPADSGAPPPEAGSPCDGLGVIAIGCTFGPPTYTCDTSAGSPQWKVSCPPGSVVPPSGCCPAGFVLTGSVCVVSCAPGQFCSDLALAPRCSDAGSDAGPDDGGASSNGGQDADVAACCPATWQMYTCTSADGGAGLACHNPALGCASTSSCGVGCDPTVAGRCGP